MTRPKYPAGLEAKGRKLWAEVHALPNRNVGPGEAILLEEACRMADRLDRLARSLTGEAFADYVWDEDASSDNQTVYVLHVNGAMAEARLLATALRGYMISLGLTAGALEDGKGSSRPKGGPRSPRTIGADEAGTKDGPAAPSGEDHLNDIQRRAAERRAAAGGSGT